MRQLDQWLGQARNFVVLLVLTDEPLNRGRRCAKVPASSQCKKAALDPGRFWVN
jgi:hypothetical protein